MIDRLEHQLVVGLGLDQDDVDAGVALLPLPRHLVQALVGQQLERLVADLREAHVADPARRACRTSVGICSAKSLTYGHERVDDDHELRARLDGDVDVRRRDDAAVDQLAVLDLDGLVDHRQRGRGAHGASRSARRPSPRRRRRSARRCRGRSRRGTARWSSRRKSSVRSGSERTVRT